MPARCPECKAPVDPGALACVNCPASWEEEAEDYRSPAPRRRALNGPLLWLVMLGAAAGSAWLAVSKALQLLKFDQPFAAGDAEAPASMDPVAQPSAPVYARRSAAEAAPEEEPIAPAAAAVEIWRLRGRVRDLTTLAPIPRAMLSFQDADTGKRAETATDAQGRYRISVPPLEGRGYYAKIRKDGYAPSYLNPGAENVDKMPAEDRASLAADVARSLDGPYTVQAYNSDPLTTDFYLAPVRR